MGRRAWQLAAAAAAILAVRGPAAVRPAGAAPQVPCYFIFGDSLVDNGNNNLMVSMARANYPPYGIDFAGGPSGRFSNGLTTVDVLGKQDAPCVLVAVTGSSATVCPVAS